MTTFEIPISDLRENPRNPRKDMGDLTELTNSVKRNGIRQNLIVTPILDDDGEETDTYRIIAGHRRFAAAKKAHLIAVPCSIERDLDEADEMMAMLEENMQRSNLTYLEEAQGVQMCLDLGISMEKIESRTGLSEQTLKHRAEIAKLTPEIVEEKSEAFQLSLKALYALEKIKDPKKRDEVLKRAGGNDNLKFLAEQAAKDEVYAERRDAIVRYLECEGMFKAPKDANRWGSEWLGLGSIDYSQPDCGKTAREEVKRIIEEMGIDPMSNDTEVVYFLPDYGTIIYIKKKREYEVEDEEETTASAENAREKKQRKYNEIRQIWDEQQKQIRLFCRDIIDGTYKCKGKDIPEIQERIWFFLLDQGTYLSYADLPDLYEDDTFESEEEEMENDTFLDEKISQFDMLQSMIACLGIQLGSLSPSNYLAEYKEKEADQIKDRLEILQKFGFSIREDAKSLLDGTSPLYSEEEADE